MRQARQSDHGAFIPTPEEIAAGMGAAQKKWTERERNRRRVGLGRVAVDVTIHAESTAVRRKPAGSQIPL